MKAFIGRIPKALILLGCFIALTSDQAARGAELALSALRSNTSLIVSWPTQYVGYYYLQRAQNLSAPWATVTDSFPTNRMYFPTDISAGAAHSSYYRLTAIATADPRISTNGLVAEYLFNGTAIDSATYQGQPRNGSIHGGVFSTTNRFGTQNCAWRFNGMTGFIDAQDDTVFSISTTGELSISAWMRPDTNTFPKSDGGGFWVYWLSKIDYGNNCDTDPESQHEWGLRMYNLISGEADPPCPDSPGGRPNWVSSYVFDLCAPTGLNYGAGSRTQCSPAIIGEWAHYVATFKHTGVAPAYGTIQLFKNGQRIDSDDFVYRGQTITNVITPANGTAPIRFGKGPRDYFFQGAIDNVRFYNRVLTTNEVSFLYQDKTP